MQKKMIPRSLDDFLNAREHWDKTLAEINFQLGCQLDPLSAGAIFNLLFRSVIRAEAQLTEQHQNIIDGYQIFVSAKRQLLQASCRLDRLCYSETAYTSIL